MSGIAHTLLPFLGGLIIGALLVWWLLPVRRDLHRLEQEKEAAEQKLLRFRGEVDGHFEHTAELVDDLTQALHAVQEQLLQGAETLCSDDTHQVIKEQLATLQSPAAERAATPATLRQPLDYAPGGEGGTLAEDFGLKRPVMPSTPAPNAPRDYAEGCTDQGCSTVDDIAPPRDY